jgi:membrane protease YdiL (CAAX protease family)
MHLCGLSLSKNPYNPVIQSVGWLACVMTPIIEELFFRGIIFKKLSQRYSMLFSAVYSSILFAIVHVTITKLISTFITGMVFCWILNKEKKIIYCIIMHFIMIVLSELMVI